MKPTIRHAFIAQLAWMAHPAAMTQTMELVYAPAAIPSPVPTLTEWGVLGLAGLLAVFAVMAFRKTGSKTLLTLGLAIAAALGTGQAPQVLGHVQAGPAPLAKMEFNTGGTVNLLDYWFGDEIEIQGNDTIAMQITSMPTSIDTTHKPTCTTNLVVPAGGSCWVNFYD